jgi:hypothetical protein
MPLVNEGSERPKPNLHWPAERRFPRTAIRPSRGIFISRMTAVRDEAAARFKEMKIRISRVRFRDSTYRKPQPMGTKYLLIFMRYEK